MATAAAALNSSLHCSERAENPRLAQTATVRLHSDSDPGAGSLSFKLESDLEWSLVEPSYRDAQREN